MGVVECILKAVPVATCMGGRGQASESSLAWRRRRDSRGRAPTQNRGGGGLGETVVLTCGASRERERG
jgi:hypothetical protein